MYANSHVVCLVEVRFSVHEFAALSCKRICTDANHGSLELQTTRKDRSESRWNFSARGEDTPDGANIPTSVLTLSA